MKRHISMMAQYHQWATRTLHACIAPLSNDEYRRDVGLFFRSIHGTLNHLLLAERLWYARMCGDTMPISGLDQELIADREALVKEMDTQNERWSALIDAYQEEDLGATFSCENTRGISMSAQRNNILAHVFNHGTHHRGQISAAMTQLAFPAPELDLLYYLNPEA